jgi:hypothetical protein
MEAAVLKDRERVQRCLEVVQAYEASGQKASVWAEAHGVAIRDLASWCAHARRWRARLQDDAAPAAVDRAAQAESRGFVSVPLPAPSLSPWRTTSPSPAPSALTPPLPTAEVRLQWPTPAGPLWLHWPLTHARELAAWLREVGR